MEKCGGRDWAFALRSEERDAVRDQLIKLSGVGPKVSYKHWWGIPRDTHCVDLLTEIQDSDREEPNPSIRYFHILSGRRQWT